MENLQSNIKEWESEALNNISQRHPQYNRLKGKVDRLKTLYDRLTGNLKDVDVSKDHRRWRSCGFFKSWEWPAQIYPFVPV